MTAPAVRPYAVTYGEHTATVWAESSGKARYRRLLDIRETCPDATFADLRAKASPAAVAPRDCVEMLCRRGIPFAWIGMRVRVGVAEGRIVGSNYSGNLDVSFAGSVVNVHPWDGVEYLAEDGTVIARPSSAGPPVDVRP